MISKRSWLSPDSMVSFHSPTFQFFEACEFSISQVQIQLEVQAKIQITLLTPMVPFLAPIGSESCDWLFSVLICRKEKKSCLVSQILNILSISMCVYVSVHEREKKRKIWGRGIEENMTISLVKQTGYYKTRMNTNSATVIRNHSQRCWNIVITENKISTYVVNHC